MQVPLLDLKAQYATIRADIGAAVAEVFESQYFILGPKVAECEEAIAAYSSCSAAVGVSSGSDALLICLMAEGIGPGDEVLTTPYTFFATVAPFAEWVLFRSSSIFEPTHSTSMRNWLENISGNNANPTLRRVCRATRNQDGWCAQ